MPNESNILLTKCLFISETSRPEYWQAGRAREVAMRMLGAVCLVATLSVCLSDSRDAGGNSPSGSMKNDHPAKNGHFIFKQLHPVVRDSIPLGEVSAAAAVPAPTVIFPPEVPMFDNGECYVFPSRITHVMLNCNSVYNGTCLITGKNEGQFPVWRYAFSGPEILGQVSVGLQAGMEGKRVYLYVFNKEEKKWRRCHQDSLVEWGRPHVIYRCNRIKSSEIAILYDKKEEFHVCTVRILAIEDGSKEPTKEVELIDRHCAMQPMPKKAQPHTDCSAALNQEMHTCAVTAQQKPAFWSWKMVEPSKFDTIKITFASDFKWETDYQNYAVYVVGDMEQAIDCPLDKDQSKGNVVFYVCPNYTRYEVVVAATKMNFAVRFCRIQLLNTGKVNA